MRRWLLWTFRCRRGRLCADVVPTDIDTAAMDGAVICIRYTCGGCGTDYLRKTKVVGAELEPMPREFATTKLWDRTQTKEGT